MRLTRLAVAAALCAPLLVASAAARAQEAAPAAPPVAPVVEKAPPVEVAPQPGLQAAAPVPTPPKPVVPTLIAKVDLTSQTMTVSENGRQVYAWRISSGRDGYPTPKGTFRAEWVAKMWYSRQYDMAPMPYAVFFKNGAAIHGTTAVTQFGSPASHGCVRLTQSNAATFYKLVNKHGLAATKIIVQGNPPLDRVARNQDRRRDRDRDRVAAERYAYSYGYGSGWGYVPRERLSRYEQDSYWPWGGAAPRSREYRY